VVSWPSVSSVSLPVPSKAADVISGCCSLSGACFVSFSPSWHLESSSALTLAFYIIFNLFL
jgi:hypothetical protein